MDREKKIRSGISGLSSRPAQRQSSFTKNGENPKAKSRVRPIRFLGKIWEVKSSMDT